MQKIITTSFRALIYHKTWLFCVCISFLGAVLRIDHYNSIPVDNWTADEYAFAWSGMSLIQKHVPTGWSWLKAYGYAPVIEWHGNLYRLVTPFLDHPPLFSLIVGIAAILGGANSLFDCTLTSIRIPSLIFGISSIILLYILSYRLYGTPVAVISSIVFATNPSLVFLSRLAVSENFILFLTLATLLCLLEFFKTSKKNYLYISAFLAGLASLAKITGIFLVILLCLLLIYKKRWQESIVALTIGLILFSIYFMYGWIYNLHLLISILHEHSERYTDILLFKYIIFQPGMPFFDAWNIFSWLVLISTLRLSQKKLQAQIVFLPIIIYLFILLFTGAQSHFYPWYFIPLYPFLSLTLGIFIYKFMRKPDFISLSLIVLFVGGLVY